MSLVVFEILTECATGAVVGTLVDFTDPCRQHDESIVETSSFPSERQFQCKQSPVFHDSECKQGNGLQK